MGDTRNPDGTPAPGTTTPAIPVPPATPPGLETDETAHNLSISRLNADTQEYIRGLRSEAKKNRLESEAEKAARIKAETTATDYKAQLEEIRLREDKAKEDQLAAEKKFEELWKNDREKSQQELLKSKQLVIDTKLEAEATKRGIPSKLVNLIQRNGIAIDSDGKVTGVDTALAAFETEYAEILTELRKANSDPGANNGAGAGGAQPNAPGASGGALVPGTVHTFDEFYNVGGGGPRAPKPAQGAPVKPPVDVTKMTKKEADAAWMAYRKSLPKR